MAEITEKADSRASDTKIAEHVSPTSDRHIRLNPQAPNSFPHLFP